MADAFVEIITGYELEKDFIGRNGMWVFKTSIDLTIK